MTLQIISIQEIARPGEQTGIYSNVAIKTGKDDNNVDFKHLNVDVDLDEKDSTGKKFQLSKTYNIALPRGLTAFKNDYKVWSGRKLTDFELASFDAEKLMKNQPVKLVVKHRIEGKVTKAVIERFLRTTQQVNA